jgi:hypothetical protein
MPRADEILIWARLDVPQDLRLPSDAQIVTTCPTCKEAQTLSEADVSSGEETVYVCKEGCQPILVVGPPVPPPWPGRGYRMGDWVLRNPSDLHVRLIDQQGEPSGKPVLIPASPAALNDESDRP